MDIRNVTLIFITCNNNILIIKSNHKSVSYNKSQNFSNTTFQVVISDFVENTLAQLLLLSLLYFVLQFEENLKNSMKKRSTFNLEQNNQYSSQPLLLTDIKKFQSSSKIFIMVKDRSLHKKWVIFIFEMGDNKIFRVTLIMNDT